MVKMLLLASLRGVNAPVKRLVTAGRCNNEFTSRAVNDNVHLYPGGQQPGIHQTLSAGLLTRRVQGHFQEENVLKSLKTITCGQLTGRNQIIFINSISSSKDDQKISNIPSPWNWLPTNKQKGRILDGLFSYGSQDILTYLNRNLGPLSINCRGFHLEPARHCKIPATFQEIKIEDQYLGTTYASQLCLESQQRLKEVAHERLKKVLRANKIKLNKHKPKKYPDHGLFKSSFLTQVEKDIKNHKGAFRVPAILRYAFLRRGLGRVLPLRSKSSVTQPEKDANNNKILLIKYC